MSKLNNGSTQLQRRNKMKSNEKGFIGAFIAILLVVGLSMLTFCVRFNLSNGVASGIVYNTKNDKLISGNTTFSVRASEDTYVSQENKSSYCLPPNSPYKELVNRAAQDKRIKIVVEAKKYFAIQSPWTCKDNVTVREV